MPQTEDLARASLDEVRQEDSSSQLATPPQNEKSRHAPDSALIDRLVVRIEKLPGPSWVYFLCAWVVLFLIMTLIKWRDRAYPVGTFFPFHAVMTALAVYPWALLLYLDRVALKAMDTYRVVFKGSEAEFEEHRYQMTHQPIWPTLIAGGLGIGVNLAQIAGNLSLLSNLKIATSPLSEIVDGALILIIWLSWGAVIFHTVRQLQLVHEIYTNHTQIDLYKQGHLYVFSGLAARTAIGLSVLNFTVFIIAPGTYSQPRSLWGIAILDLIVLVTFFWPLWGIHRVLEQEKSRLLVETALRVKTMTGVLHQRIDSGEIVKMDEIDHALASLVNEQRLIAAIPTWPWQPDQIRLLITTLLLPILLWLSQQLLKLIIGL